MRSQITTNKIKEDELKFPCLRQDPSIDLVVLFTSYSTGVVLFKGDSKYEVGQASNAWEMNNFILFTRTIEISN